LADLHRKARLIVCKLFKMDNQLIGDFKTKLKVVDYNGTQNSKKKEPEVSADGFTYVKSGAKKKDLRKDIVNFVQLPRDLDKQVVLGYDGFIS